MATALFDRVVPAGKDATFPFQMSATGLTTNPTVYQIAGSNGAQSTVGGGVSVVDAGGGIYRLVVANGNMSGGNMYFGVVTAGDEVVRIPLWSYGPTDHIADVLSRLGGSANAMSFGGILSAATNMQDAVDVLGAELGDVSAAGIAGSPASVAAALKVLFDEVDGVEESATSIDNKLGTNSDGAGTSTVFARLTQIKSETATIDGKVDVIDGIVDDIKTVTDDWKNGGRLDLILDELTAQGDTNEGKLDTIIADTNELQSDWANGGRLDLILDELTAQGDTNEGKLDIIDGNVDQIEGMLGTLSDAASADYATDKTAMGMIRKLGADVAANQADLNTILADTNELQSDWADGGRLDLLMDGAKAAAEAARDDLANGTDGLGALKGLIDANQVDLDAIIADLGNGTDGLGALKGLIDANQVDLDAIIADLSNGTDGLGALKALIDTVNSDLSNGTDGLGALKALIDNVDGDVVAAKAVIDETNAYLEEGGRIDNLIDGVQTTANNVFSRIGAPAGASVSADIAAVKAVADTLQLQVNAILQPMVPSERYSGASAKRFAFVVQTIDGASGALDDMDQAGTPAGQMYVKVTDSSGNNVTDLYDAVSGGSALAAADGTIYSGDVSGYRIMSRLSTGFYQGFLQVAAYKAESYDFLFYAKDSDPQATQTFRAMRQMDVRSPVVAQFAGGSF
jgi:hypothetical protein